MEETAAAAPRRRGRPRKKLRVVKEEPVTFKELQGKVESLEEENRRLTQLLARQPQDPPSPPAPSPPPHCRLRGDEASKRTIGGCVSPRRKVVLRVAYLGDDHPACGGRGRRELPPHLRMALLAALQKAHLVDDPHSCRLESCEGEGRLGSLEWVVSAVVRSTVCMGTQGVLPRPYTTTTSSLVKKEPLEVQEEEEEEDLREELDQEIKYAELLNEALPPEVRVLAWSPTTPGSNPAPDTLLRSYKYFFPRGDLDLQAMDSAAQDLLSGVHQRAAAWDSEPLRLEAVSVSVRPSIPENSPVAAEQSQDGLVGGDVGYGMCVATITGCDLTREEVRRVMAVLLRAGQNGRQDGDVTQLLNKAALRSRKQSAAPVASEEPLHLSCTWLEDATWMWDVRALAATTSHLQTLWAQHAVRAAMMRDTLQGYEGRLLELVEEVPQDQCKGLPEHSLPHPRSDHEYSSTTTDTTTATTTTSRQQGGSTPDFKQEEEEFSLFSTLLLIELARPRLARLLGPARSAALREVQGEMGRLGVTCSIPGVSRRWASLLSTYRRLREQGASAGTWEYFEALDSLLGDCDLPSVLDAPQAPYRVKVRSQPLGKLQDTPGVQVTSSHHKESVKVKSAATRVTTAIVPPSMPSKPPVAPTSHKPPVATASHKLPVAPRKHPKVAIKTECMEGKTPSAPTTFLHHDRSSVFATQSGSGGEHLDPTTVFLEYHLQQGAGRREQLEEHLLQRAAAAARRDHHRRRKEEGVESSLAALAEINDAFTDLKTGLLEV